MIELFRLTGVNSIDALYYKLLHTPDKSIQLKDAADGERVRLFANETDRAVVVEIKQQNGFFRYSKYCL